MGVAGIIKGHKRDQSFSDGIISVYALRNIANPGNQPRYALKQKHVLRYQERIVGITRRNYGKQNNAEIERVIRCPRLMDVSTQDIAIPVNGGQYRVYEIQYPPDVSPPCMDLTLTRVVSDYEVLGNDSGRSFNCDG